MKAAAGNQSKCCIVMAMKNVEDTREFVLAEAMQSRHG